MCCMQRLKFQCVVVGAKAEWSVTIVYDVNVSKFQSWSSVGMYNLKFQSVVVVTNRNTMLPVS